VEHNLAMFGSSASGLHPEQRRSPRFPFDSLVRVTASRPGEAIEAACGKLSKVTGHE
jgi:hypothetical protein